MRGNPPTISNYIHAKKLKSPNKFKISDIMQSISWDYNAVKLEINNRNLGK